MLLRASAQGVTLDAPRDLTTLSLILEGAGAAEAAGRVGEWLDDDHLLIAAGTLRELAGPVGAEQGWRSDFETMLEQATKRGFVDELGNVRVHVERR